MTSVDVAIVGAGIIGTVIAQRIAATHPGASVVVLEKDAIGSGASRRSAGVHFPRGGTDRVRRMSAYSQEYYEKLAERHPELPIHPLGMSIVSRADGDELRETYLDRLAPAAPGSIPEDLARVPDTARAWHCDGGHYAEVRGVAEVLARDLQGRVEFREGVRVTAVEPAKGATAVHLSTGGVLTAGRVVLAPGPWLNAPAWRSRVAAVGARVKKVVALHVQQAPRGTDPSIVFHDEDAFLLPLVQRGHWLFSYTCTEWDVDPDDPADGLAPHHVEQARECLRRYSPQLAAHCTAGRVFCDAYSGDGEPVVRGLDGPGRIVFAGAANGSGYRLAPAIAAQAVDLLDLTAA